MSAELYLIAHKVRGEPAFDVATRMQCPECDGIGRLRDKRECPCAECDSLGFWWIIPTSGHRAFPYWNVLLLNIDDGHMLDLNAEPDTRAFYGPVWCPPEMPPSLPDHYPFRKPQANDLTALLGTLPKAPSLPIRRR